MRTTRTTLRDSLRCTRTCQAAPLAAVAARGADAAGAAGGRLSCPAASRCRSRRAPSSLTLASETRRNSGCRSLSATVSVFGKSALLPWQYRCLIAPWPAAKFGAAIVGKGLNDLGIGVHHKRAMLRHRFIDWLALQQQKFAGVTPVLDNHFG